MLKQCFTHKKYFEAMTRIEREIKIRGGNNFVRKIQIHGCYIFVNIKWMLQSVTTEISSVVFIPPCLQIQAGCCFQPVNKIKFPFHVFEVLGVCCFWQKNKRTKVMFAISNICCFFCQRKDFFILILMLSVS